MENTPNKMMTEAESIAKDAIEGQVDTKIWRTRLRIQELILAENPYLKKIHSYLIKNYSSILF